MLVKSGWSNIYRLVVKHARENVNWIRHPRIACGAKGRLELLFSLGETI